MNFNTCILFILLNLKFKYINNMRKLNLKRNLNLRSFVLTGILALAIFAVSCEKETDEFVTTQSQTELKSAENSKAVKKGDKSIAEIAIGAGFTELVAALSYVDAELDAGLVNLFLNGTDQYTVFAPTDEAFSNLYSALGIGAISDLPAELVRDVLFYHVTDGRRAANSVVPKNGVRTIDTLLGVTFDVNPDGSIDAVGNSANITAANISASNGIIHVIDTVILPIE